MQLEYLARKFSRRNQRDALDSDYWKYWK